jgi:D-3-phosphoglycerate dehydrogenase
LTEGEIMAHLDGVDGLIAGLEPLTRRVLESAPRLKAIARVGIGMENIDLAAAEELGKIVSNTPEGPTQAVAEMCLCAILSFCRNLIAFNRDLHAGIWRKSVGVGLSGIDVLLVGYGRIGRKFAEYLRFFGATISVVDPCLSPEDLIHGEHLVALEEGLQKAQVISLHASGHEVILGAAEFQQMSPGVMILNSARAGLVDEKALMDALDRKIVGNVWFDAFWQEPYQGRLRQYEQALLTPHVSTYTRQCRLSMEMAAVSNLLRDLGIYP